MAPRCTTGVLQVRLHGSRGGVFVGHRPPRDPGDPLQIRSFTSIQMVHTHTSPWRFKGRGVQQGATRSFLVTLFAGTAPHKCVAVACGAALLHAYWPGAADALLRILFSLFGVVLSFLILLKDSILIWPFCWGGSQIFLYGVGSHCASHWPVFLHFWSIAFCVEVLILPTSAGQSALKWVLDSVADSSFRWGTSFHNNCTTSTNWWPDIITKNRFSVPSPSTGSSRLLQWIACKLLFLGDPGSSQHWSYEGWGFRHGHAWRESWRRGTGENTCRGAPKGFRTMPNPFPKESEKECRSET